MNDNIDKLHKVTNPLTMIALFSGVAEAAMVAALPLSEGLGSHLQTHIVHWITPFVVLFPIGLAGIFFIVLWNKHWVLYGPGDYSDENLFARGAGFYKQFTAQPAELAAKSSGHSALMKYWKPDGITVNEEHEAVIEQWLEENGLGVSVTLFMASNEHAAFVDLAALDLGLIQDD